MSQSVDVKVSFRELARSQSGRRGRYETPTVSFETPVFMPVGTRGSVRLFPPDLLELLGFEVMLSNTYHLMLRPGPEVVESLGGLHSFTGWRGAILTDSGGFQVMSLGATSTQSGAKFKSVYDGSHHTLTPEGATQIQEQLGSDIAMVLDVCTMLPADAELIARNLEITHDWAMRARRAKNSQTQAQFGIVQGGTNHSLRRQSVDAICEIGFEGYAIGGLAVGEERSLTLETIARVTELLPKDRPRYLMGVGDPYTVAHAIGLGVDMFDCVSPSRIARHGVALTSLGKVSVKQARFITDSGPLDPTCDCPTCQRYALGLLNHLYRVDPQSAGVLLTRHNLAFMARLIAQARSALSLGHYEIFLKEIDRFWS